MEMVTFTGKWIDPNAKEFNLEDFCIEDIAHSLSLLCRYGGHTKELYSVGQHSIYVSYCCRTQLSLHCLLHDAAEAYIGDMIQPLKWTQTNYCIQECIIHEAIYRSLGIVYPTKTEWEEVKRVDLFVHQLEKRDLFGEVYGIPEGNRLKTLGTGIAVKPTAIHICAMSSSIIERDFLKRYNDLMGENTNDRQP